MSSGKIKEGRCWTLKINEFILKIVFDDQTAFRCSVMYQFHTTADGHDLSPFRHMCGRNIDYVTVFVAVLNFKTIIRKNSTSLHKRSVWKRNGFSVMDQRTKKIQNALNSGPDHNIVSRTVDVSSLTDVVSKYLTKIGFTLGFSIGEKTVTLTKCAFDITLPEVKTETFMIDTVGSKVILY